MEHERHIKTPEGKSIPYWRNMKTCEKCYQEHEAIINRSKWSVLSEKSEEALRGLDLHLHKITAPWEFKK